MAPKIMSTPQKVVSKDTHCKNQRKLGNTEPSSKKKLKMRPGKIAKVENTIEVSSKVELNNSEDIGHSPNNLLLCVPPTPKKQDDIDTQSQETRLNKDVVSENAMEENLDRSISITEDDMVIEIIDDVGKSLIFLECAQRTLTNFIKKVMSRDDVMIYAKEKERKMRKLMNMVRKNVMLEEVCELRAVIFCEVNNLKSS